MNDNQATYSNTELATILKVSVRRIQIRAKSERWEYEAKPVRGGVSKVYPYATLPPDVKAAIAKYEADNAPKKIIAGAVIPEWSHRIGLARYQIVNNWKTHCRKQKEKGVTAVEATASFLTAYNTGMIAKDAFDIVGEVKKSSLYRWNSLLRENGDDYYAICDLRGKWSRGEKKSDILSPEAAEAFLACWLNPRQPSVTLAARGMEAVLVKQGLPVPSMTSVYRYAKRFDSYHHDIVVLKREGEKALKDKVLPYIKRARPIFCRWAIASLPTVTP